LPFTDHDILDLDPARHAVLLRARSTSSVTADEIVLVMSDGTRETWTRAPAK